MMALEGDCLSVTGPITLANVVELLESARVHMDRGGVTCVDLGGVTRVDSSALALLLAWCRLSIKFGGSGVRFQNVGKELVALAHLYGVESILDLPA